MNRFLNKKKAVEPVSYNDNALHALSSAPPPPVSPGIKKSGTSRWKKNKKPIEPKPEFNIVAALPSSDDFRTSLMMPSFSARFSMLREQDDPNSILGKASDDSVLQPRRRSRMTDFGFASSNLGDIAEVSSVKSSVRPPFAFSRQDSYASEEGYGSENDSHNGSMMSRSRPGEGNVLFGGRQKVYMIPKAGASSTKNLGKPVYEDDIKTSAFQKHRQQQRQLEEGRASDESQGFDFGLDQAGPGDQDESQAPTPNDSAKDLSHSPSLSSYEKKRSTTSTSHSEARSSTAATSIASQPVTITPAPSVAVAQPPPTMPSSLKRSDTKTRRLYEQGLDQHMYEQQTSALTRLNSIQRQRTLNGGIQSPPFLHNAKSTGNLHDRPPQPVYALRTQSPPLAPLATFGSMKRPNPNGSPLPSGAQSPTSPHGMDYNEGNAFMQALVEPGDRGKATAMGAFNKPNQAFDENQYLERQRQLQRSNSNALIRKDSSATSYAQQRLGHFEQDQDQDQSRERSDSSASARSRSRSAPRKHEATKAYNVFQRAATQNAHTGQQQFDKSSLPDTHRTFFGNISASDSEEEDDDQQNYNAQPYASPDYGYGTHHGRWQPTPLPSVSEHPALRSQKSKASLAEEDEDLEPRPLRAPASSRSLRTEQVKNANAAYDVESPILPLAAPLNSMMQHLRQKSNQSSIFPMDDRAPMEEEVPEMPEWNPKNLDLVNRPLRNTIESESRVASTYANSNPWDLDDLDQGGVRESHSSISPIEGVRPRDQFSSRAPSRATLLNRQSEVSQLESDGGNDSSWQNELRRQHNRDPSTATQQEREGFDSELAARRNAIQENIKKERENQSRGVSPAPSSNGAFKAFGMLRSKSSRESVEQSRQAPVKAMKMLGISGPAGGPTNGNSNSQYERTGYSLDIGRPRDNSGSRPPLPTSQPRGPQQNDQDARREWEESRSRGDSETSRPDRLQYSGRSPASSAGGRSRANSEATTGSRSRSRTGPYRDDLEKSIVEATGTDAAPMPAVGPMVPRELTPRASPDTVQHPFDARNNSRAGMTDYFDAKALQPIQTGRKDRLAAGGPSPITLSPNVYSPALSSTRPSPVASTAFAQNMTPPLSGANTPVGSTFGSPPVLQGSSRPTNPLRKKTISKGDISEPTLVMSTSNIDTVDLPEGASLKNGMDEPPPVPQMNPRRRATHRMFSLGQRKGPERNTNYGRSKTPDPWVSKAPESDFPFELSRPSYSANDSRSPPHPALRQRFDSPNMRQDGFIPNAGSPERIERSTPPLHPVAMEGGMF